MLGTSLADPVYGRDARRAVDAWRGESTIWLLPDLDRIVRWKRGSVRYEVGVPSEAFNRIDVHHLGSNGHIVGLGAECFPNQNVNGVLDAWLNTKEIDLYLSSDRLRLPVPRIENGQIREVESEFETIPGSTIPIVDFDASAATFTASWPPPGAFKTMSPEAESLAIHGHLHRTEATGSPFAVSSRTGMRTLCCIMRPRSLPNLFPDSAGWDVLYQLMEMRRVAKMSAYDTAGAVAKAQEAGGKFLFNLETSQEWQWFWPTVDHGGSEELVFGAEDHRLHAHDWPSLRDNPEFKKYLMSPVRTPVAWGPLGLFWTLLLDHFQKQRRFDSCEGCGRIFQGKRRRRLCSAEENRKCYDDRRAADQRRSRERRKSLGAC